MAMDSQLSDKEVEELLEGCFPGGFSLRDEANALTAGAFRTGLMEAFHADQDSKPLQDSSLKRMTQEEMKRLMIYASSQLADLLMMRKDNPDRYRQLMIGYNLSYCRHWER